jgi:CRP-like cAMP-binding protein
MFFVLAGEIRLIRRSRAGGEIVLQRSRAGFIAEASLGQSTYHCDGVVPVTTEVLSIPQSAFIQALEDPPFRGEWLSHLCHELRRQRALSERLSLRSAADRILHFIGSESADGRLVLGQSKKDWAAQLGLTHEAVYRGLAELTRKGLIGVDGRTIWLRGTSS